MNNKSIKILLKKLNLYSLHNRKSLKRTNDKETSYEVT